MEPDVDWTVSLAQYRKACEFLNGCNQRQLLIIQELRKRLDERSNLMTIDELVARSYKLAVDKGWAEKEVPIPEQVALICSEACEGLEEYRKGMPLSYDGPDGKPEGLGPEYADILIRIGHYARKEGIDLTYEVKRKLAYNETRPHRHGGKLV